MNGPNGSPEAPRRGPGKSVVLVIVIIVVVCLAAFSAARYWMANQHPTASPANMARWQNYAQQNAHQVSQTQAAYQQHQAILAKKRRQAAAKSAAPGGASPQH